MKLIKRMAIPLLITVMALLASMPVMAAPSISHTKVVLQRGDKIQLTVTGYDGPIKWKSSKKAVAKVNGSGVVTARKKGSATITAKCGKMKLKCKVKVAAGSVKSIKLNATTLSIKKGGSYKLKATVSPKGKWTVKWKSSKKSVVSVNSKGKLKAKKTGTATITAKCGKVSATCKVTVTTSGGTKAGNEDDNENDGLYKSGINKEDAMRVWGEPVSNRPLPAIPAGHVCQGKYTLKDRSNGTVAVYDVPSIFSDEPPTGQSASWDWRCPDHKTPDGSNGLCGQHITISVYANDFADINALTGLPSFNCKGYTIYWKQQTTRAAYVSQYDETLLQLGYVRTLDDLKAMGYNGAFCQTTMVIPYCISFKATGYRTVNGEWKEDTYDYVRRGTMTISITQSCGRHSGSADITEYEMRCILDHFKFSFPTSLQWSKDNTFEDQLYSS